jgi:hypothetical protein
MNIQSAFVSQKFQSRQLDGKAQGMHAWGAERPIDPQNASLSVWGKDELNLDLSVGGPVIEKGFEDRGGYHSSVFFRGFPKEALPTNGGLKEGMHFENEHSSMSYSDGTLTVTKEETIFEPRFLGLGFRESEKNAITVEIETNPDMTEIGDVHYKEESRDKKFFGGYELPETVTDLHIQDFQFAPDNR